MVGQNPKRRFFWQVKREICEEFRISEEEFDSPSKALVYVWARRRAWWLGATECQRSNAAMGRDSGGRCPSTVLYGLRMYRLAMEQDSELGIIRTVMERRQDRPANGGRTGHDTKRSTGQSRTAASQGSNWKTN